MVRRSLQINVTRNFPSSCAYQMCPLIHLLYGTTRQASSFKGCARPCERLGQCTKLENVTHDRLVLRSRVSIFTTLTGRSQNSKAQLLRCYQITSQMLAHPCLRARGYSGSCNNGSCLKTQISSRNVFQAEPSPGLAARAIHSASS